MSVDVNVNKGNWLWLGASCRVNKQHTLAELFDPLIILHFGDSSDPNASDQSRKSRVGVVVFEGDRRDESKRWL